LSERAVGSAEWHGAGRSIRHTKGGSGNDLRHRYACGKRRPVDRIVVERGDKEGRMKVLVTAASKYGATAEIAQAIGDALAGRGIEVSVQPIEQVASIDDYKAIVVGSAVYAGHWLKPATQFVEDNNSALRSRAVWLFSSGPVGDPPKPEEDPVDAAPMVEASGATEHRLFAGKLDKSRLSFVERAIATALRAPEGDYRDWDAIREWSRSISTALRADASGGL
jgi:menaquinone-dependent protoporphyrinogen oxidase